jgi:hypothetical protein
MVEATKRETQAADTEARLQAGVRSAQPVPIPGAREPRADRVEPTEILTDPAAASARAVAVLARIRLDRERAAAASGRRDASPGRGFFARLWRRALRGPAADVIL